jgi:acetyl esterase/lipase
MSDLSLPSFEPGRLPERPPFGTGHPSGPPPNGPDFGRPPGPPPMMDTSVYKRKWLDVPYALQSPNQRVDIYLPDEGKGPFPVIAVIHGGAFMMGDKRDVQQLPMLEGLKRGYAVVCIEYRLSGEAIFPAQIYDCKAAIRFLRANAQKYGFDAKRIAAWGGSAGGHLSSLVGTSAGVKDLEDLSMGFPAEDCSVQAVVDWYGPTEDFLKMDEELQTSGCGVPDHSAPESPESLLLGSLITEVPELVRRASPMTYVSAHTPPFLIQHGLLDQLVPVQQSIHFAEAIEKAAGKDRVTLELFPGVYHADPAFETPQNTSRVLDFLDSVLKK